MVKEIHRIKYYSGGPRINDGPTIMQVMDRTKVGHRAYRFGRLNAVFECRFTETKLVRGDDGEVVKRG